jgi:DNA polymerase III epsilon subunit-like protein
MASKKPWVSLDTETTGLEPSDGARVLQVAVHVTDDECRDVTRGGRVKYSSYIKLPIEALKAAAPRALEVNHFAKAVTRAELKALPNDLFRPRFACGPLALEPATDEMLAGPDSVFKTREYPTGEHVYIVADYEAYVAAPPPYVVWQTVHQMITGCHLTCQNVAFDKPFIENELALCGLTFPCDFRTVEIMSHSNLLAQHLGLTAWGLDKLYDAAAAKYGMEALSAHRADGDVARMMAVYKLVRSKFLRSFEQEAKISELEAKICSASSVSMELEQGNAALEAANARLKLEVFKLRSQLDDYHVRLGADD